MSPAKGEKLIEVKGLEKHFKHVEVLRGINIDICKGDVVAVIGPSGSGKSTFLRCLNLLEEPTGGQIVFEGVDITSKETKIDQMRQKIGMVFQQFNLFTNMTVLDNVSAGPVLVKGMKKDEARKLAQSLLERVGLGDRGGAYPIQLSGGQQQRVALARALVITPDVLLMDEPLSNLDAKLRLEMRSVIRHTQKDVGITTVYVTHDQEEAMAISDTIAVMKDGVIQHVGTPKDIYQRPKNVFVATFIGRTNIIPARVENGAIVFGNGYRVEMDCLKQTAGQEVLCSVRPEEFVISPDGTEGISGVVKEYTYLGLNTHYFVETDDGQKTVEIVEESSIEDELKPGQRVLLQVKKHKINVFNKEGSVNLVRSEAFYEG